MKHVPNQLTHHFTLSLKNHFIINEMIDTQSKFQLAAHVNGNHNAYRSLNEKIYINKVHILTVKEFYCDK